MRTFLGTTVGGQAARLARVTLGLVAGVCVGAAAMAQSGDTSGLQAGAAARGLRGDAAYEVGDLDSVNLFNGNLTLSLPIGGAYPADGALEYSLVLTYNSNVWDLREIPWPNLPPCGPKGKCTPDHWVRALPSPLSNAGLGWTLSLGRLFAPHDPQGGSSRTLEVELGGAGSGLVFSSPSGIHCGSTCSAQFPSGSQVVLGARPGEGSTFAGWAGPADCLDGRVTLTRNLTCRALFEPGTTNEFELEVRFDARGIGTGTVVSSPAGIDCPPTCEAAFDPGTDVALSATAAPGSQFTQWRFGMGSECTGTEPETHVVMRSDRICEARFDEVGGSGPYTLTVSAGGPFGGTVHVTLPGEPTQDCHNTTCSYQTAGQDVVLIADTPASCSLPATYLEPECELGQVVMTGNKSCTAIFPRDPSCPLSPGLLGEPVNEAGQWMYAGTDGAKHLFYDRMQPGEDDGDPNAHYTRDATYLRLLTAGPRKVLEFGDGSRHFFDDVGNGVEFRLSRIEDAFGNSLDITYSIDAGGDQIWDLVDSTGRRHRVTLGFGSLGFQVEKIELAAFGGRTATYELVHQETVIERDCRDTDPATSTSLRVPLLVEIRLPDGSGYDLRDAGGAPRYLTECAGGSTVKPPIEPPPSGKFTLRALPFGVTGNEGWIYSDLAGTAGGIDCTLEVDGTLSGVCDDDFDANLTVELTAVPQGLSTDTEWFQSSSEECLQGEGSVSGAEGETYDCNARFWCDPASGGCRGICTICPSCCVCVGNECFPVVSPSGLPEPNGDGGLSGALTGLRLPTRGQVEWEYGLYYLPQKNLPYLRGLVGVVERRHLDASGALSGSWTYDNEINSPPPWPTNPEPTATHTDVVSPDGTCRRHYFSGETIDLERAWSYGLPFTWDLPLGSGSYVSTETYAASTGTRCAGAPLRTTGLEFDRDGEVEAPRVPGYNDHGASRINTNRRLKRSITLFHDDQDRFIETIHSNFDGLGRYRRRVVRGDLEPGDRRVTFTNYLLDATPAPTERWLLGLFDFEDVSEDGVTARVETLFEPATGFALCRRVLASGTSRGRDDVIVAWSDDGRGNVASESWRGGDVQNAGAGVCGSSGAPRFRIDHSWSAGVLASSRPAGSGFARRDDDIDPSTGLVAVSRDSAGVATSYDYDLLGRLVRISPRDSARTDYTYRVAAGSTPAKISIERRAASGGAALTWNELWLDGFGRVERQRNRLPGGAGVRDRWTTHDAQGRVRRVSEWGAASEVTLFDDHDPFARPRRVVAPDGSESHFIFVGQRVVERRASIGQPGGAGEVATTELYDSFGRLSRVVEPSDAGADVVTDYDYNVGGRLIEVSSGLQRRTFTYDNRGFLLAESHPEWSAPATWGAYDPRGNAGRRTGPGGVRLDFVRDPAERLVRVDADGETLKEFFYDGATGFGNGKLWRAQRHNRVRFPGRSSTTDHIVEEIYTYQGRDGRISERRTQGDLWRIRQTFGWDRLGALETLGYPICEAQCTPGTPQDRSVTYQRDQGRVVSVGDSSLAAGWIAAVTFHGNGTWASARHSNGVEDRQGLDPDFMRRPASRSTLGVVPSGDNWSSGALGYDGSGNIVRSGLDTFAYDEVHRLVESVVAGVRQDFTYDAYGNLRSITTDGSTRVVPAEAATNRLGPASTFQYDARGNLRSWSTLGECRLYDELDMIRQIQPGCASETTVRAFLYTADDQRVATVDGPLRFELTVRDLDGRPLRSFASDPSTESWSIGYDHIWLEDRLIGFVDTTGRETHVHTDHLGTPRLLTDASAAALARHDYAPFGEEISDPGQSGMPLRFTGHQRDTSPLGVAGDLDYMHARYYSPWWGRFTSIDPVVGNPAKPQTWNRYAYTQNQPVNFRDASGAYREDFHHDLTEVLALAAGYSAQEAREIARQTQSLDEDPGRDPFLGIPLDSLRKYHFVDDARMGRLMTRAFDTRSAEDIGTFLHAGQDRFSHRGFRAYGGPGIIGHATALTAPDRTSNDPAKALAAAEWTFRALVALRGEAPSVEFGEISTLARAYLQLGEQWTDARERNLALIRKRIRAALKRAVEKPPL